ncbi:MAG: 4Fe-4S dicluster domain-containing protein [Candidatus Omnitrophota bacterium]
MKRKIITIDEDKCTGCKLCIPNCPEGALQIIDGKARLVSDLLCDGLGACIGHCPEDAIHIEEREAEEYDEYKTMKNIVKAGSNTIKAHINHLRDHGQKEYLKQALDYLSEKKIPIPEDASVLQSHAQSGAGCPGIKVVDFRENKQQKESNSDAAAMMLNSELSQWPIQLKLLNPLAPYFEDRDLVIAADCVPFAYANFHQKFLKNKALIMFCPKLDQAYEAYLEKLTAILKNNNVRSISIVRMEVPCCYGTVQVVEDAVKKSGKTIIIKEYTISLKGEII